MDKKELIFKNYPKTRPPLPKAIEEIYVNQYKSNREGNTSASSITQKVESWMHKQVASDVVGEETTEKVTLELGAGTLNQLQYEPDNPYYDIVEPFTNLYVNSPLLNRIRNVYKDISEIPESVRYDRITSIATLEHICNLPEVIATSGLLLSENGSFRASIPSEGTLLWTLGWRLTTGLEFKIKYGLDYGLLMKHEHVNDAKEIKEVLGYFFNSIEYKVFGLTRSLSLYHYYECRDPKVSECSNFIEKLKV